MDTNQAIEILKSKQCRCGKAKGYKTAFCRDCYYALSPGIRKALYNRVGFGFEQSYELAARTLDEKVKENGKMQ